MIRTFLGIPKRATLKMIHSRMPNNRLVVSLLCLFPAIAYAQQSHDLPATPATVAWGYYWSQAAPVLRIKSGDRVTVHTMITNSPDGPGARRPGFDPGAAVAARHI